MRASSNLDYELVVIDFVNLDQGDARLGILVQVVAWQLFGKPAAELRRMPPGSRAGIDQAKHVNGQAQATMKMGEARQIQDGGPDRRSHAVPIRDKLP